MRTIIKIVGVERKKLIKSAPKAQDYWKTYALLDDGTEAEGYGKNYKVGDQVEVFHDKKWDQIKMQHKGAFKRDGP